MFRDLRRSLFAENRRLVLLVEDITGAQGVDRELLYALQERSTTQEQYCDVVSVVGITPSYYRDYIEPQLLRDPRNPEALDIRVLSCDEEYLEVLIGVDRRRYKRQEARLRRWQLAPRTAVVILPAHEGEKPRTGVVIDVDGGDDVFDLGARPRLEDRQGVDEHRRVRDQFRRLL
jgi:hypothetical protein